MEIKIVKEKISKQELKKITEEGFGTVVKAVIDVEKEILALGGEWHSEAQDLLFNKEYSNPESAWGINFHPFENGKRRIEYVALINIKPALGNREMEINDSSIRQKIKDVVEKLLLDENETL
ncbi:hypothetical protein KKH59_03615 [Patescibacteria group bacterium]|nr:hypothetical protein [Patescibacteria group bacterium]